MISNRREFARAQFGVFGASLAAWIAIAASSLWLGRGLPDFLCSSMLAPWLTAGWVVSASLGWLLMVVAMMAPMTLPAVVHLRLSTFTSRRGRATALFFLGFAVVWLIPGLAMKTLETTLQETVAYGYLPAALAALVAGVWQCSPLKQRCLNRCHAHRTLQAFGLSADLDALRFGLEQGVWCVGTCWALMLVTVALPRWHLVIMPVVALLAFSERLELPRRPAWEIRRLRMTGAWLRRAIAHARASGLPPRKQPRLEAHARERGLV